MFLCLHVYDNSLINSLTGVQVRNLEIQLAQLKAFQRDQALKLNAVAVDKEALEIDNADLQVGIKGDRQASLLRGLSLPLSLWHTD